jgi:ABC-type uncharacterized transport system permease subunit
MKLYVHLRRTQSIGSWKYRSISFLLGKLGVFSSLIIVRQL